MHGHDMLAKLREDSYEDAKKDAEHGLTRGSERRDAPEPSRKMKMSDLKKMTKQEYENYLKTSGW